MKKYWIIIVLIAIAIVSGGLYYNQNEPIYLDKVDDNKIIIDGDKFTGGNANVESIDILFLESWPLQVMVGVTGIVNDSCTKVIETKNELIENTFYISLDNSRDPEIMCAQVITQYQENVSLEVYGLEAGVYKVNINGVEDSFEFTQDNSI